MAEGDLLFALASEASLPASRPRPLTSLPQVFNPVTNLLQSVVEPVGTQGVSQASLTPGAIPVAYKPPTANLRDLPRQTTFLYNKNNAQQASSAFRGYQDMGQGSFVQRHSGLKVKNPVISSSQLEARLDKHAILRLSAIKSRHYSAGLGALWASMAVVGEVSGARTTSNGRPYSIWKLTDLNQTTVSLYLFGKAHQEHGRDGKSGLLMTVLRAKVQSEGGNFSLSVDSTDQVLLLGTSAEFAYCKAQTKVLFLPFLVAFLNIATSMLDSPSLYMLVQDGTQCRRPVNVSRCEYCSQHVAKQYKRLQSLRNELGGGTLKTVFKKSNLKWNAGSFTPAEVAAKPQMKSITGDALANIATKAAHYGCTRGAHYTRTIADPGGAKAAYMEAELERQRRSRPAMIGPPIPLARAPAVVMNQHISSKGHLNIAKRKNDGTTDKATGKRGKAKEESMVDLEEDDIFESAAAAIIGSDLHVQRVADANADVRKRALEALERNARQTTKQPKTSAPFLELAVQHQRENKGERYMDDPGDDSRQETDNPGKSAARNPPMEMKTLPKSVALPLMKRTMTSAVGVVTGHKPKPKAKGKANQAASTAFEGAFGSVISQMEAQDATRGSSGSLYRDIVEEDDAQRLGEVMDVLEKKDSMAQKMDAIKSMQVTAWRCDVCQSMTEYRSRDCGERHPHALQKVTGTKRWWECGACKRRFSTVGLRYPNRCQRCDVTGPEQFKPASMLRPERQLEHEMNQGKFATREALLTRGREQKWVNQ